MTTSPDSNHDLRFLPVLRILLVTGSFRAARPAKVINIADGGGGESDLATGSCTGSGCAIIAAEIGRSRSRFF